MRNLGPLLAASRGPVLQDWARIVEGQQAGAGAASDASGMGQIFDRLIAGLTRAVKPVIADPAFSDLVQFMTGLSAARAREGLSPTTTAQFMLAFKAAAGPVLAAEYTDSPERWQSETKSLGDIIDQLAILTFEAYAEAREEVIHHQSRAILEISTPALRIWHELVMMPLVGIVDTRRAQHIMEQLLTAIAREEARVAILDVTGIPVIDTRVALHLTKVVTAARMLGAEVIVTGFSPEAAQTLVSLDVDLSQIRTRGTLRAGLAEALRFLNKRIVPVA